MSRFVYFKDKERFLRRVKRLQRAMGVGVDGVIGNEVLTKLESLLLKPEQLKETASGAGGDQVLSKASIDLIVNFETGGEGYYRKYLQRPAWPGYSSGVTIGFGYDVGYYTAAQIRADWGAYLTKSQLNSLIRVSGIRGSAAMSKVAQVRDIVIPWETAQKVFQTATLPKFVDRTLSAFPGAEGLRAHAFGALVSLVFNRGSSMSSSSRRTEMRNIRQIISKSHGSNTNATYAAIGKQIRSMKRLWTRVNGVSDLHGRRDAEAKLVEDESRPKKLIRV